MMFIVGDPMNDEWPRPTCRRWTSCPHPL